MEDWIIYKEREGLKWEWRFKPENIIEKDGIIYAFGDAKNQEKPRIGQFFHIENNLLVETPEEEFDMLMKLFNQNNDQDESFDEETD